MKNDKQIYIIHALFIGKIRNDLLIYYFIFNINKMLKSNSLTCILICEKDYFLTFLFDLLN